MRAGRGRSAFALLLCLTAIASAGCGGEQADSELASEGAAAYEIELPEGWTEASADQLGALQGTVEAETNELAEGEFPEFGVTAVYFAPGDAAAAFRPNINVVVKPVPEEVGEEQFFDLLVSNLERLLPGVRLEGAPETTSLDGAAAIRGRYQQVQGEMAFYQEYFSAIHEGRAYTLTLTADSAEERDALGEGFDEILGSWSWTG